MSEVHDGGRGAPYLPVELAPTPTMDERGFWEHCKARRLMFQRCGACGAHRHPPTPICPTCQSAALAWTEAPLRAQVYSYTIVHHPPHPDLRDRVPYNVVVLTFAGIDGVRLVSNVVDVAPEDIRIGMEVELRWEGPSGGYWLPRFARVASTVPTQEAA